MGMDTQRTHDLPLLPDLAVIRNTYCSQQVTDSIVGHLHERRADLIADLVKQEKRPLPDGHDDVHGKAYGRVIEYLREHADKGVVSPPTRLGMLDLLYE